MEDLEAVRGKLDAYIGWLRTDAKARVSDVGAPAGELKAMPKVLALHERLGPTTWGLLHACAEMGDRTYDNSEMVAALGGLPHLAPAKAASSVKAWLRAIGRSMKPIVAEFGNKPEILSRRWSPGRGRTVYWMEEDVREAILAVGL